MVARRQVRSINGKAQPKAVATEAQAAVVAPGWWLSPVGLLLGFLIPVLCFVAYVGEIRPIGLTVRGLRFLDVGYLALAGAILCVMAVASHVGSRIRPAGVDRDTDERILLAAKVLGWITLVAYILWLRGIIFNPAQLYELLTGQWRPTREEIGQVSGASSFVNVAPAFSAVVAYLHFIRGKALGSQLRLLFICIAVLTPVRVYLWSERLALIEFVLPIALCWFAIDSGRFQKLKRFVRCGGPYLALPLLVLYFGVSEYVRSWQSETYQGKLAFWDFATGRLASYYYTALNNGAGMLFVSDGPDYKFTNSFGWIYKLPFGIGRVVNAVIDAPGHQGLDFLPRFGDPEFTNPSGVFSIVYDMGLPLALVYLSLVAFTGGLFYRRMVCGRLTGALVYPIIFMSFIEIFRVPYFGSPRAFTWTLGIVIALLIIKRPPAKLHPYRTGSASRPSQTQSVVQAGWDGLHRSS